MKRELNAKFIDSAKPEGGKDRTDYFDTLIAGLCLRVSANGKKVWSLHYTKPGTRKRAKFKIGRYPDLGLKAARERASGLRVALQDGVDPHAAKAAKIASNASALLVTDLLDRRFKAKAEGKQRNEADVKRRYDRYIRPVIGNLAVRDFDASIHHQMVLSPIIERGAIQMANVVHRDLVALFGYAVNKVPGIKYNLMGGTEAPAKYVPCDRALSAEEIKILWHNLAKTFPRDQGRVLILKLLLATGQRSNEVAGMAHSEIDLDKRLWTIPEDRVKNGYTHAVPLSDLAMKLIREARTISSSDKWLFPIHSSSAPRNADAPTDSGHVGSMIAKMRFVESGLAEGPCAGVDYWTPHDLRRTVVSHMLNIDNGLDIPDHHVSCVVNHRSSKDASITHKVYNTNNYNREKRAALDKWGKWLSDLVGEEVPEYGLRLVS